MTGGFFLDNVKATSEGYLYITLEQKERPPLLWSSENLWKQLHPPPRSQRVLVHMLPSCRENPTTVVVENEEKPEIHQLMHVNDLWSLSKKAVDDIIAMKDKQDADRAMPVPRDRLSVLRQQQAARMRAMENPERKIESNNDDDDDNNNNDPAFSEGALRTVRTLNSIRALFPLLLAMLNHERRTDKQLEIQAEEDGKVHTLASSPDGESRGAEKNRCWMLGEYVFDVVTKKQMKSLRQHVYGVLHGFVPESSTDVAGIAWDTFLVDILQQHRSIQTIALPQHILKMQGLPQAESESKIREVATRCDQQCLDTLTGSSSLDREGYKKAMEHLVQTLEGLLANRFRGSTLRVYGSWLSDLSLGKSSDVDLSLSLHQVSEAERDFREGKLTAEKYARLLKKSCFAVAGTLKFAKARGFANIVCIHQARVPVVKGTFRDAGNPYCPDGTLDFDICLQNDIAVVNSTLLSHYALVNEKVKLFLLAVKSWAQENKINSAAGDHISSYAWMNMGIFYLQVIGMVPNLQCQDLMAKHGFKEELSGNPDHFVDALHTAFLSWQQVQEGGIWKPRPELEHVPVSLLLYGFFHFFACAFPTFSMAVSIRQGRVVLPKTCFEKCQLLHLCIEDPFETYDSHVPHDLGTPATVRGQHHITQLLREAEEYLGAILRDEESYKNGRLWLTAEEAEKQAKEAKKEAEKQEKHPEDGKAPKGPEENAKKKKRRTKKKTNGTQQTASRSANQASSHATDAPDGEGSKPQQNPSRRQRRRRKQHAKDEEGQGVAASDKPETGGLDKKGHNMIGVKQTDQSLNQAKDVAEGGLKSKQNRKGGSPQRQKQHDKGKEHFNSESHDLLPAVAVEVEIYQEP